MPEYVLYIHGEHPQERRSLRFVEPNDLQARRRVRQIITLERIEPNTRVSLDEEVRRA